MAQFFKMKVGKITPTYDINEYAQSAAKSGSGGGNSSLPKAETKVGATGDHVAGSGGSNSSLPKGTTKVGLTGDNAAK